MEGGPDVGQCCLSPATWVSGQFESYTNGMKVVLPDDPKKVHLFNTSSNAFVEGTCADCGRTLVL